MKSKQNKYSQLYAKIDRKQLSEQALATLDKLRLATGNFRTKNQESLDLFQEFYDKLSEKKPTAIKGSPENKAMIKEMLKERGRKLAEGRKAKQKEKTEGKSEGNEIDANRPAKPFGWRMRGKHNYKKPTRADITEGRAYYEGRVNRADVKRKKYPMLKRGGKLEVINLSDDEKLNYFIEKQDYINKKERNKEDRKFISDMLTTTHNGKKFYSLGYDTKSGGTVFSLEEAKKNAIIITDSDLGKKWDVIIKEVGGNFGDKDFTQKSYVVMTSPLFPNEMLREMRNTLKYEDGGYMAKGGNVKSTFKYYKVPNQNLWAIQECNPLNQDGFGSECVVIRNKKSEEDAIKEVARLNSLGYSDYYAKGGEMEDDEEGVDLFEDYEDQPKEVSDLLETLEVEDYNYDTLNDLLSKMKKIGYTFEFGLDAEPYDLRKIGQRGKSEFYAKGGYMENGGEVGKSFTISEMNEKLNRMFPDSFGFSVGTFSNEGNKNRNSSALIANENDPFRGLKDTDIDAKLFFPQYKKVHDIRFRIYQGGENTYFHFNLESEKGDEYIGQFGFKDQGNVPSSYITRFIAFLMEQYGLPFEVNHSVMAKGGEIFGDSLNNVRSDAKSLSRNYKQDMFIIEQKENNFSPKRVVTQFTIGTKEDVDYIKENMIKNENIISIKILGKYSNGELKSSEEEILYMKSKYAKGGEVFYTEKHKND